MIDNDAHVLMCSTTECPLRRLLVDPPETPTYSPMCLQSSDVSGRSHPITWRRRETLSDGVLLDGFMEFHFYETSNMWAYKEQDDLGHHGYVDLTFGVGRSNQKNQQLGIAWTNVMLMMIIFFWWLAELSSQKLLIGGGADTGSVTAQFDTKMLHAISFYHSVS